MGTNKYDKLQKTGVETGYQFTTLEEIETQGYTIIYPKVTPMISNQAIVSAMKRKSLSQRKLARLLSVQAPTLQRWIKTPETFPLHHAIKTAYLLDIPVEELFPLTPESWFFSYPVEDPKEYYLDMATLKMVTSNEFSKGADGFIYYDTRTKEPITFQERRRREMEYINQDLVPTEGRANEYEKGKRRREFLQIVIPRFVKVAVPVSPFKL